MNFQLQLLQHLRSKRQSDKGFTLIELLVVVIIVGVLAAIALPNLIGQVGKARESEAKTLLGSVNKSQQSVHTESGFFYETATNWPDALGITQEPQYYAYSIQPIDIAVATDPNTDAVARMLADAIDPTVDGTRDFAAGIDYAQGTATYTTVLCVADIKDNATATGNLSTPPTIAELLTPGTPVVFATGIVEPVVANNQLDAQPATGCTVGQLVR
ncbi:MAG: type IV pilin-like G/H family protein [Cyanobacteria bacterium P01_H01_bin.15]